MTYLVPCPPQSVRLSGVTRGGTQVDFDISSTGGIRTRGEGRSEEISTRHRDSEGSLLELETRDHVTTSDHVTTASQLAASDHVARASRSLVGAAVRANAKMQNSAHAHGIGQTAPTNLIAIDPYDELWGSHYYVWPDKAKESLHQETAK